MSSSSSSEEEEDDEEENEADEGEEERPSLSLSSSSSSFELKSSSSLSSSSSSANVEEEEVEPAGEAPNSSREEEAEETRGVVVSDDNDGGSGGSGGNGGGKGFNSNLALLKSVPAAARAAVGGHILRGAVRNPQSELAQGRWLRTLATAKKPGTQDRSLGVTVVGGGGTSVVLLRSDAGATARATFVPADSGGCGGGDALMKLDGVLWPF